jgi:N-acetylornithine carbamoyltransferase
MQTGLRGRDLIALSDWTNEEIETALDVAFDLKRKRALGERHAYLLDKTLAMLFFFSSTRTRASFEAGMAQLGGHGMFMESRTTQIAHGDTATEIGEILGRYNDGIAIRHVTFGEGNQYIRDVAAASRVPVLNMQCEIYHPFQILADLMTIIEKKGRLKGQSITISWAYASSYQKPISVPQSLLLAATRFGMDVKLVHPPEFELMPDIMAEAKLNAARAGGAFEQLDDFDAGFDGADIVYAKSWGAHMQGVSDEEGAQIAAQYTDWISDERRMAMTEDDAIWMHPLPADRGVEVADAVIDGPKSAAFDEAENRLHAQKAVMALTMG